MGGEKAVKDVTQTDFDQKVIQASTEQPVVVDFWAPWCGPCKTLGPILESMAEEADGHWTLAKVNVDDNQSLAQQYGIRGIPAVKAFVDGEVVDEFTGARRRPGIERWLDGFLPSEVDDLVREGHQYEADDDLESAAEAYGKALDVDEQHTGALVGLARIAVKESRLDEAEDLLGRVPLGADGQESPQFHRAWFQLEAASTTDVDTLEGMIESEPDDLESRYELAVNYAAQGDFEPALEHLLEIVERDRSWRDDLGRETMLRIFEILGPGSDDAREWQKKLGRAMY